MGIYVRNWEKAVPLSWIPPPTVVYRVNLDFFSTSSKFYPDLSTLVSKKYIKNTIKFLLFAKSKLLRLFLGQSEILDLALWLNRVLVNYLNRNAFFIYKIQVKYIDSHVLLICYVLLCYVMYMVLLFFILTANFLSIATLSQNSVSPNRMNILPSSAQPKHQLQLGGLSRLQNFILHTALIQFSSLQLCKLTC